MKYVSDITHKCYESEKECKDADLEYEKQLKANQQKLDAEKKEKEKLELERGKRFNEVKDAFQKAYDLQSNFLKDFGTIHYTITQRDNFRNNNKGLLDIYDSLMEVMDNISFPSIFR